MDASEVNELNKQSDFGMVDVEYDVMKNKFEEILQPSYLLASAGHFGRSGT